jgi:hypothetical protein
MLLSCRHKGREGSEDSDDADSEDNNRLSRLGMGEADRHFVDAAPAWKPKLPPFRVLVHSPSKWTSTLSGAFTIYVHFGQPSANAVRHLPLPSFVCLVP